MKKALFYIAVILVSYVVTATIRYFFGTLVAWATLPIFSVMMGLITYKIWPFIEEK